MSRDTPGSIRSRDVLATFLLRFLAFMSTRVYHSKHTDQTTHEEETLVCLRIQLSRATVKELHSRLQHAYQRDDVRLVRRITVLIDLLVHQVPVEVLRTRWGLSPS